MSRSWVGNHLPVHDVSGSTIRKGVTFLLIRNGLGYAGACIDTTLDSFGVMHANAYACFQGSQGPSVVVAAITDASWFQIHAAMYMYEYACPVKVTREFVC